LKQLSIVFINSKIFQGSYKDCVLEKELYSTIVILKLKRALCLSFKQNWF